MSRLTERSPSSYTMYCPSADQSLGGTLERLEIEGEVASGLEALVAVLLQAVTHDTVEGRGDGLTARGKVLRVVLQDRVERLDGRVALEGASAAGGAIMSHPSEPEGWEREGVSAIDI